MKPKVGFMGLGIMGAAMAANILKAGYPLTVYNRTTAKAEPLAQLGARVAASPKALAQDAEIIIAMVTGPEALYELLFGPGGRGRSLRPGAGLHQYEFGVPQLHPGTGERTRPHGHPASWTPRCRAPRSRRRRAPW